MRRPRPLLLVLGVALAVLTTWCVLGDDVARAAAVLLASAAVPITLIRFAPRRGETLPSARVAHGTLLAGAVLLVLHDGQALANLTQGTPDRTGAVFATTLALGYLGVLVGGILVTTPLSGHDAGGALDAAIVTVVATSLAWTGVVQPVQQADQVPGSAQLYELVIILLASAMAGVVVRAWVIATRARAPLTYLLAAVTAVFTGHLVAVLSLDPATGTDSPWVDAWWVASYLGLAAAFSHPDAPLMGTAHPGGTARLTRRRLVLLGIALAVIPLALVVGDVTHDDYDGLLLAVAAITLAPLVLGRIATLASLHAAAERRLAALATQDELTGLPNRRAVTAHLADVLDQVAAGRSPGAVVAFLDLDDFKETNDEHGHATGDRLLVEVGRRLRSAVRSVDVVGRFGGDEFVVVMQGAPDVTRDAAIATLTRALTAPVDLDGFEASARASIGTTLVHPGERTSAEHVLSAADAAMYVTKRSHRAGDLTV